MANSWANPNTIRQFPKPLQVTENTQQIALSAYCGYWMEPNDTALSIEKVKQLPLSAFQTIEKEFFHRGYFENKNPLWFTFKLQNTSQQPLSYFFEIPYSNIDQLQLFETNGTSLLAHIQTGTQFPFERREVEYRNFIYKITLAPNSTTSYYLRVEKDYDELFLPFQLSTPEKHVGKSTQLLLFDGFFYGFLITILLISFGAAGSLRDKVYLTYALMMTSTLLFHLGDSGIGFELIWHDFSWFQLRARSLGSFISQGAFMLFIIYFFEMNFKRYPILTPISWLSVSIYVLLTVHSLFFKDAALLPENDFFVQIFIVNILSLIVIGFAIIIKAIVLKHRGAFWFLAAFSFPVIGCFALALRNAGVFPSGFWVDNFFKIGHFFMFLILNVAMAKRMQTINEERISLLREQGKHQKALISAGINAIDTERKRIADDLHDSLGALLVSVKHHFASVAKLFEGDNEEEYRKIQQMLEQTYMKTRKITHSMKPPQLEKFGLVPVLEDYCSVIDTNQLSVYLWINGLENNRLSYSEEHNIFRIIQELATNTIKYAQASELVINISREGSMVSVTVEDDGLGFDSNSPDFKEGLGTRNIQERVRTLNGTIDINTSLGKGTSVFIEFTTSVASVQDYKKVYADSKN